MADATGRSMEVDEFARRANVPIEFVGATRSAWCAKPRPVYCGWAWAREGSALVCVVEAGFPPETIMRLVDQKALSISFLDSPDYRHPADSIASYQDIAE